jgi:phenylalanyl-tRNA synthetase beta chain
MRVPYTWLRELVPLTDPPEALMDRLALLGFGHEPVETHDGEPVLVLEVASNRPDLLGLVGIAREVAAALRVEPTLPAVPDLPLAEAGAEADVTVEVPDRCPRFTAHVITGVRVRPSPPWMVRRLEAAGVRAINTVVDVTNYVMLEQGQPMHAFDLDRLAGRRIVVRLARAGERLVTLDGVERMLPEGAIVVADGERAVGLAGIMGGLETAITPDTRAVLLEAASWHAPSIRRTARAVGLRTESSARFERRVDPRLVLDAARRAAALLCEVAGGEVRAVLDVYPRPPRVEPVPLRLTRIPRLLGIAPPRDEVVAIFRRLGCAVEVRGDVLRVTPPPGRIDLEREEDLIEEVARHHGYDRIPERLPVGPTRPGSYPPEVRREARVRDLLIRAGLSEALTLSLTSPGVFDRLHLPPDDPARAAVPLLNPLMADLTHLRTMVVPGLLEAVRVNRSRGVEAVHLFEIGRVFRRRERDAASGAGGAPRGGDDGGIEERRALGVVMAGPLRQGWNEPPQQAGVTFFDLKGVLEAVTEELGLAARVERSQAAWLHPGRTARLVLQTPDGSRPVGVLGELHPAVAESWDLDGPVYAAEVDLDALLPHVRERPVYLAPPRLPAVERDLAVVVEEGVPHAVLAEAIRRAAGPYLERAELFDVYTGPPVPPGHRSLAFRLRFRAPDRTLTAEEAEAAVRVVAEALARQVGARPRT